ncbi:MAG: hypothetical protein RMH75_06905 [Archaeoglobaceae archaeon]|nr:hypothetical protein [Archaeoglobaceae archaeon]MDW7990371.1 hypothetical protein [Archaeoglobaceae archaeon]
MGQINGVIIDLGVSGNLRRTYYISPNRLLSKINSLFSGDKVVL